MPNIRSMEIDHLHTIQGRTFEYVMQIIICGDETTSVENAIFNPNVKSVTILYRVILPQTSPCVSFVRVAFFDDLNLILSRVFVLLVPILKKMKQTKATSHLLA